LFDSGEIEPVAFVEDSATTVIGEPEPAANARDKQSAPLFGMDTEPVVVGSVLKKWSEAKAGIAGELEAVDRCRANEACPATARRLLDLSAEGAGREGRARVGLINRAVDRAISPVSDEAQWGTADHWSAPAETLQSSRGDCEDYAIVKYAALVAAGLSEDNVKIVIVRNAFPNEAHAVVAARVDGDWLILDNRTLTLVHDIDLTRATPELVLDRSGVRRFVSRSRNHHAAG
jgi:predicted transglutaminase-like cysteine proteinase